MTGPISACFGRAFFGSVLTAAAVLFHADPAGAFCRTTTCDPNAGDTCRKNENGCVRDGVVLKWKTSPITYRFHRGGSEKLDNDKAREAIRRAFDAWENVTCTNGRRTSLRFQEGSEFNADKPLNNKQAPQNFGIYFRDTEWPHDDAEESLALTNQVYGKVTGTIDYADIEINTAVETFSLADSQPGIDLQAVLTHEVGHYIGLAHSNDPTSIMVARYCQNQDRCGEGIDRKRELSEDDIIAVCAAFEPPRIESGNPPPTTCTATQALGASSSPRKTGELASLGGIFFAAMVVIARRRRRRRHR
jgi:hypothetical protein